jgi:hypothetical protein
VRYVVVVLVVSILGSSVQAQDWHEMRKITSLTVAQARRLATRNRSDDLWLTGLTSVTPEVAAALAKHQGSRLMLDGITSVTPEVAAALAKHQGDLSLGLTELSDESATALARHRGGLTIGNKCGPIKMSDAAVRTLGSCNGHLSLRVSYLSDDVIKVLSQRRGGLSLSCLSSLSVEAAKALVNREDGEAAIYLNEVKRLDVDTAKALRPHKGLLMLLGVETLSPDVAKALAGHRGPINLRGLKTLSYEAAVELKRNPEIMIPDEFR